MSELSHIIDCTEERLDVVDKLLKTNPNNGYYIARATYLQGYLDALRTIRDLPEEVTMAKKEFAQVEKGTFDTGWERISIVEKGKDTMPDEQGYSGWTNYETWCVNLWLTNDEGLYRMIERLSDADAIEEFVDDLRVNIRELSESGMFNDLLSVSLQSVNWHEIYDALHEGDEEDEED